MRSCCWGYHRSSFFFIVDSRFEQSLLACFLNLHFFPHKFSPAKHRPRSWQKLEKQLSLGKSASALTALRAASWLETRDRTQPAMQGLSPWPFATMLGLILIRPPLAYVGPLLGREEAMLRHVGPLYGLCWSQIRQLGWFCKKRSRNPQTEAWKAVCIFNVAMRVQYALIKWY